MKKILVLSNRGTHISATFDFACYIAGLSRSKLTGVFLEELEYKDPA